MKPLFSIITVCRNCRQELERTLVSVAGQSCNDYEHFVVDGASNDGTVKLLKDFDNPRLKYVSEPDNGIYDAMNKGMSLSDGKYLIFLNAGDTFHSSETLDTFARAIRKNNTPGIVYGQTVIVDASGKYLRPRHLTAPEQLTFDSFRSGMLVCHQAMAVLRRIAVPYDTRFRFSADFNWVIQCLQHSRHNVSLGDTVVADYLEGGATTKNRMRSLSERFRIMCRYYGFFPTVFRHCGFVIRAIKRKNI